MAVCQIANDGKTAVFSSEMIGCAGGAMGLGFGRPMERQAARTREGFLPNGIERAVDRKEYETIIAQGFDEHNGENAVQNQMVDRTLMGFTEPRCRRIGLPAGKKSVESSSYPRPAGRAECRGYRHGFSIRGLKVLLYLFST